MELENGRDVRRERWQSLSGVLQRFRFILFWDVHFKLVVFVILYNSFIELHNSQATQFTHLKYTIQ